MDGFDGAPVSRLVLAGSLLASLLLPPEVADALNLDLGRVLAHGEVWRLVTHHACWSSFSDAALGSIALFQFRRFERYLGSRKFCVFVAFSAGFATALVSGLAVVFGRRDEGVAYFRPAPGPYALVGALFGLFYAVVPVTRPRWAGFSAMGAHLSDKSLMYALGAQLAVNRGLASFAPSALGLLAGFAYLNEPLGLRNLALPRALEPLFAARPREPTARRRPRATSDEWGNMVPDAPPTEERFQQMEPSEENVAQLEAMGFDRDQAYAVLLDCHNDLQAAVNKLLSG